MVTLGQNFRFGFYDIKPYERMLAIKNAQFDNVMFWWGDEFEITDGSRYTLFDDAVKIGLNVSTVHFPSTNAHYLWYDDERAASYVKQFETAAKDCGERKIRNLVFHVTRTTITPSPNEFGITNFRKIIECAEKYNVTVAIENTRFLEYNDYLYKNVKSDKMGFCFDCGHANCFTPTKNPLEMFSKYLTTTHIHDNMGAVSDLPDQHHMMGEGNIDFDKVFSKLFKLKVQEYNLESYCNESSKYYGKVTVDEYLSKSYGKLKSAVIKSAVAL